MTAPDGTWVEFEFTNPDGSQSIISRTVTMTDTGPGDTSGSDLVYGNGGHDDL